MRAVIQRVSHASVSVDNQVIGQIQKGFMVLLGVGKEDTKEDLDYLLKKVTGLRVFEDEQGKMNLSLKDVNGGLLVISQFTLYADTKKGYRPSFTQAGDPEVSKALYLQFIEHCRQAGYETAAGEFGAHMEVELLNSGPVTIIIDSKNR